MLKFLRVNFFFFLLTKQQTLLGRGAWVESRRVRKPGAGLLCYMTCNYE